MSTKARFRIKNWKEYQHSTRKGRKPHEWVKLHRSFWADFHVRGLTPENRLILLGVVSFCESSTGAVTKPDEELCYLIGCKSIPWKKLERWCIPVGGQVADSPPTKRGQSADKTPQKDRLEEEEEEEVEEEHMAESSSAVSGKSKAEAEEFWAESFDRFYESYPKKQKRKKALEFWMKIPDKSLAMFQVIMAGVEALNRSEEAIVPERRKFVPQPSTWLNQECWENEYEVYGDSKPKLNAAGEKMLSRAECEKLGIPYE